MKRHRKITVAEAALNGRANCSPQLAAKAQSMPRFPGKVVESPHRRLKTEPSKRAHQKRRLRPGPSISPYHSSRGGACRRPASSLIRPPSSLLICLLASAVSFISTATPFAGSEPALRISAAFSEPVGPSIAGSERISLRSLSLCFARPSPELSTSST
eukprot:4796515-Pleurochrysis_carterae.AAC.2